uniref:Uncharacterized protein n=1 Tax=Parasteatoda tepidariorum TaxID=114398 RepID=A0A2L2YEQ7_PARTP
MARLAAYYQEDFQYRPENYVPKHRKSSYVYYEEPLNNAFNNFALNGERRRNLALSEPSLSPLSHACKPDRMTLKNKPIVYGSQLIENSHPPMQYFDNDHNMHYSNNRLTKLQTDAYDNEPYYHDDRQLYGDRSRHWPTSKDKLSKRFSYVEPRNNNHDVYLSQHYDRSSQRPMVSNFDVYNNRYHHPEEIYYDSPQNSLSPCSPVYYHNGTNNEHWQQWPFVPEEVFTNQRLLSPPSPLDSGLSSQSITSSPSLEADSFPSRSDSVAVGERLCSCPSVHYPDINCQRPNLSRHDSGRSSGVYPAYIHQGESLRVKNGARHISHSRDDTDINGYQPSQVRYGKLGLIGEHINNGSASNKPKKNHQSLCRAESRRNEISYKPYNSCNVSDNGGSPIRRTPSRASESLKKNPKFERPFVVITEASEKSTDSDGLMSPEGDNSEKSDDMESSSSTSATVSDSSSKSSVASSSNDLNCNRKSKRTTEKEIRELEDMYEKCNLSDVDLLDRAERRDLPTAHQKAFHQTNRKLKRSKSDTIYETLSPMFHNPYETHQRAPPFRRSGLPDRLADDMALRKLKKCATTSSSNATKNSITYMLCSSHFTPTVPSGKDILFMDCPDVEYDDLSYRKHYFGKKSKIPDPQPPFGIPLRPPPPQKVFTDYLHAIPSNCPQPLCHPRGNPDVVRDDVAFRALRKDEPERLYYDISQLYRVKRR